MVVGIWGGGDGDEGGNGVERGRRTTTTAMMGRSVYAKLRAKCELKRLGVNKIGWPGELGRWEMALVMMRGGE
jgi:hypothetical protein